MPSAHKRPYRIETYNLPDEDVVDSDKAAAMRHHELLRGLASVKAELKKLKTNESANDSAQNSITEISKELLSDLNEARKLQEELMEVHDAIEQTKREIYTIHKQGIEGREISRVSDELDAIVGDTESATESILERTEDIDQLASQLVAALSEGTQRDLACDIQDHVVKIFEACNFQDLTGQRISKVVSAFHFVDEKISKMLEIWGGIDSFKHISEEELEHRLGDGSLLNGPALEIDEGVASQNDIDALFD